MRRRLRPAYSAAELAALYARPHDHTQFPDHLLRVDATIAMGTWMLRDHLNVSVADLSTGNGQIPTGIAYAREIDMRTTHLILGDYAPQDAKSFTSYPRHQFTGPIEETIERLQVAEIGGIDLFVCSETIEHLDDPEAVLKQIRYRARKLLLSTPIGETDDGNPEHYWGWDAPEVGKMLRGCGWNPSTMIELKFIHYPYDFQIWGCD